MSKAKTQSLMERIKNVAKKRNMSVNAMVTELLLERVAARLLADPTLQRHLIFKGGYVSCRVYDSPRHTTDIDAIVHSYDKSDLIAKAKAAVLKSADDGIWFHFEKFINLKTQQEYGGTRLMFRGGIGESSLAKANIAQIINLDIGTGDPVTPAPKVESTAFILGDGSLSWQVYNIETIIAEKLHPLVALGADNSRSKDIFDLHLLLPKADLKALRKAIAATFEFRQTPEPESFAEYLENLDQTLLRRGWKAALSNMKLIPDFSAAFDEVVSFLRNAKI